MARTFIPTCITRGHVEVFTAKGTEVYAFSHLSAASSMDTAQRNAFAAATNAVRFLPGATGYQFVSGTETIRVLGALPTHEPRLKLECITPAVALEAGAASLRVSLADGRLHVEHGTDDATLLEGPLPAGGWGKLIACLLEIAPEAVGPMGRHRIHTTTKEG